MRFAALALAALLAGCASYEALPGALVDMPTCVMFCTISVETQTESIDAASDSRVSVGDIVEEGGDISNEGPTLSLPGL